MSLLNQVLRELDQRQGGGSAATLPSTPATLPAARRRVSRWLLGVLVTTVAVVGGGIAQGSLRWPIGKGEPVAMAMATPRAVERVALAASSPVAIPASPASEPTAVAQPLKAANPDAAASATTTALARPTPRKREQIERPAAEAAAPSPPSAVAEARIDKRSTARTPQERAESQYQRGVALHQAGQIDDAAQAYAGALREDATHAAARMALAGVMLGQSRQDDALAMLREGNALAPAHPQLALMLARLLAERQDWSHALDTLAAASAKAQGDADFLGLHAAILQRANRHAEAADRYGAALRLKPAQGVWWMGLAISLEEVGQQDAARSAFQRAKAIGLPDGAASYVEARLRQLG